MIVPLLFLIAGMAFGAPTALGEDIEHKIAQNPETMKAYVRHYFADEPVLADIAWCESRFRHLGKDGEIFRGKVNQYDIGVMQINTLYHEEKAVEMNMDLFSLNGNLAYARYLYEKEGTKPWMSSAPCWGHVASK
jgi:hypothetical protein